ncbi:hypothetical protein GGI26_004209 [Coemansia sp. RSA 1358]|nr:hypothetical protein BX070DRAFT_236566 [Coemansia spiralis]KAJ2621332.1 hypothetical protein GGI26_004209 [Coemansia sp. RSA 1358]
MLFQNCYLAAQTRVLPVSYLHYIQPAAIELNFLIAHYLSLGPLQDAALPLRQALESTSSMLPPRHDWLGNVHARRYDELVRELPHIASTELLRVVQAITNRDSAALLTAGGTLLGRTCKRLPHDSSAKALSTKLRRRSKYPGQPLQRPTSLPLSVFSSFKRLVRCHGHKYPTFCVLFDRTSRRMITGSDDYLVKVWCTRTGYLINTFKGHQEVITDIALNIENTLLASASADGTVRIWSLKTGEPRAVLVANPHGRAKSITAVKFSPSPRQEIRFLATTCDDGLCRLYRWDRQALKFDQTPFVIDGRPEARDTVTSFAFSHTGSRFAIATSSGYVSIYSTIADAGNAPDGAVSWGAPKLITRIAAHDESITTLVFSGNGEMFLTGSTDGTAKVWRSVGAELTWKSISVDIKESVPSAGDAPELVLNNQLSDLFRLLPGVAVQPVADASATANADTSLLSQQQQQRRNSLLAGATRVAEASSDSQAQSNPSIDTIPTGLPASTETPALNSSEQSAGAPAVPLASENNTALSPIATLSRAPGNTVNPTAAPTPAVKRVETNQVAWVCDGSRVIISNNIGTVAVFDPQTGKECWRRRAHGIAEVYVLIPHPSDPRIAVSGGYDGRAILWNIDTGDILREFKVGEQLFDGSFSEDGLKFALTSESGAATLFGLGPSWAYEDANKMPEQMFDNDYTATIMDENHFVADQQTQIPSYLVPHSALMDFDGHIYRNQKGSRFGLGIESGVDELKFSREDNSRMAALNIELEHAYLDHRAAQAPVAEVHPSRGRGRGRRRGATGSMAPRALVAVEEAPELELPIIIPMDDDSDDEEYNAVEDDEEEEENEIEDDEDERSGTGAMFTNPRSHRRGMSSVATDGDYDDEVEDPHAGARDRRSALELLRSRHGSATAVRSSADSPRRSTRRTIEEDEDEDEDYVMDVDGGDASHVASTQTSLRRRNTGDRGLSDNGQSGRPQRGGARRLRINVLYESESLTSDEDFQPRSATTATRTGRPRGRPRRNTTQRPADTGISDDVQRQTRNRRIASDSDEDDYRIEDSENSEYNAGPGANGADIDVDIDGLSVSDNEQHAVDSTTNPRPLRRANRLLSRNNSGSHMAAHGSPRTRSYAGQRPAIGEDGNEGSAHIDIEHAEDHALTTSQPGLRNGHMRVPRSNDNSMYSDGDSSSFASDSAARNQRSRRQNKHRNLHLAQASNSIATTSSGSALNNGIYQQYKPTDWILATKPSTVPYRPQIGDIVVYFKEGHEDFWKSPFRCKKLNERLLPYVAMPNLSVAVFGKVTGLRYAVGPPTYCTVKLQLLENQTIEDLDMEAVGNHELTHKSIQVQYHDCEGIPDFIILYSRYRASLRSSLKGGDSVSVLFDEDQAHRATIIGFRDIKPTSRQTSVTRLIARNPWKSITVEWADSDGGQEYNTGSASNGGGIDTESKTECVSPWELVHDDDAAEAEIPTDVKETLLGVVNNLRSKSEFVWFVQDVDYKGEYPEYLLNIAYPMCLNTIYDRLRNGFYRHINAVSFDMGLIQENADTFNDPGTPVPIAAQKLAVEYRQLLDQATNNEPSVNGDEDDSDNGAYLRRQSTNSQQQRQRQWSQPSPKRPTRGSRRSLSGQSRAATIKSEDQYAFNRSQRTRKRKTRSSNDGDEGRGARRVLRRTSTGGRSSQHLRQSRRGSSSRLDSESDFSENSDGDEYDSTESKVGSGNLLAENNMDEEYSNSDNGNGEDEYDEYNLEDDDDDDGLYR